MRIRILAVALVACGFGALAGCEKKDSTSAKPVAPGEQELTQAERNFMSQVAQINFSEIALGHMAVEKGTNPDVKSFAQRMIDDHTRANQSLKAVALQKGVELPAGPSEAQMKEAASLAAMKGAEFDRHYVQMMVTGHDNAVALFEEKGKASDNRAIRSYVAEYLPVMEDHAKMAHEMSAKMEKASSAY